MEQEQLPTKLRILRAREGLTLADAAERIGVGRDTLSDLERGRHTPVIPTLAKIARGYGVPVEELLETAATTDEQVSASPKGDPPVPAVVEPDQRSLVFLDQLRGWMTAPEARVALKVDHATLTRLCDEGSLRCVDTPLGRLFDPHCVSSLKNRMIAEKKA